MFIPQFSNTAEGAILRVYDNVKMKTAILVNYFYLHQIFLRSPVPCNRNIVYIRNFRDTDCDNTSCIRKLLTEDAPLFPQPRSLHLALRQENPVLLHVRCIPLCPSDKPHSLTCESDVFPYSATLTQGHAPSFSLESRGCQTHGRWTKSGSRVDDENNYKPLKGR